MTPMHDGDVPARVDAGTDLRAVPDRLLASWRRSEDYGVPLDVVDPVFAGTRDEDSLFVQCGREVLTALHQTLLNEPLSLMLTDADGLVLNRFSGDTSLLRALDRVHLAPGFAFSEREVGTNGLGLALADRVPTIVRAEQHYNASLCTYTCAAVPVLDPVSGRLEGSVNITTWSRSRSDLLLALAQSAAGNTAALMLARSRGQVSRPTPRGEVFRVERTRLEPGSGTVRSLSRTWTEAVDGAVRALSAGHVAAAVGESGSGRATLLAQALRQARPRERILSVSPPAPEDVQAWLSLWAPEVGKPDTAIVVCDVDALPAWAAAPVYDVLVRAGSTAEGRDTRSSGAPCAPWSLTAERFDDLPGPLAGLVDTVVEIPPLRERPDDVLVLAQHVANRARGRTIDFTPAAERALRSCAWPGNIDQLNRVIHHAATRTDMVDTRHLPAEVLSGSHRRLTRIEAFERDEIVRCLTRPGVTMKESAAELGMSRATLYRKISQYDLHIPRS